VIDGGCYVTRILLIAGALAAFTVAACGGVEDIGGTSRRARATLGVCGDGPM
jgi:hypothetical protein